METVMPKTMPSPYRDRKRYAWLLSLLVPCTALRRAWKSESDRLRRDGKPVLSLHNEILQQALITVALWRYVMNERLLAVVGRDAARINIDPGKRNAVIRNYGLVDSTSSQTVG